MVPTSCRWVPFLLAAFLAGCNARDEAPKKDTKTGDSTAKTTTEPGKDLPDCCSEGLSRTTLLAGKKQAKVDLKVASVKEIESAIASHKGKIVVMDIWADFCIPCKQEFPHLVEMHHKYAGDGVQCLSVTVDEMEGKEGALKFLNKVGAVFPNFLVNEDAAIWQEAWDVVGVPVVRVYGRDGKLARQFDYRNPEAQFTYADVEGFVRKLLETK